MKIKKIILLFSTLFMFTGLFAASVYDTADNLTLSILQTADDLIEKKQYESAFNSLKVEKENEYIIAKKIEILINYFSHSQMHQLFCLSDLKDGQTLDDVRGSNGTFNLILYDPVEVVKKYTKKKGEKPILNYSLGLYYNSVFQCYSGCWLISDDEIINLALKNFEKAYNNNCFDENSLSIYAWMSIRKGDLNKAKSLYDQKLTLGLNFDVEDNYNYGIIAYHTNNYDEAIKRFLISIEDYKDTRSFLFDTYYMIARSYLMKKDYQKAISSLNECIKIYEDDYRPYNLLVITYCLLKDKEKLYVASENFFKFGPSNPTVPQMLIENYYDYECLDLLPGFFDKMEVVYSNDSAVLENLYFHQTVTYYYLNNTDKTSEYAKKALEVFEKNGTLTKEIKNYLTAMIK